MHRIKMPPFATPDKTVTLECLDYFSRPTLARKSFQLDRRHPAPVRRFVNVEIDCSGEGVIAQFVRACDLTPVKCAREFRDIRFQFGLARQHWFQIYGRFEQRVGCATMRIKADNVTAELSTGASIATLDGARASTLKIQLRRMFSQE